MRSLLRRLLVARPDFVRLIHVGLALGIAFDAVELTEEQIAVVISVTEALFQTVAKVAFAKDIEQLNAGQ